MKKLLLALMLLIVSSGAQAIGEQVIDPQLEPKSIANCTMPTVREKCLERNVDGTCETHMPLAPDEIAGTIWYWGYSSGVYVYESLLQPACQFIITNVPDTTSYYVVEVVDTDGRHSSYSEEITHVVGSIVTPPKPVMGIVITPYQGQ